jgi:UDP-N-acetylglucosamine diphosphorylase / glucose-1-phosphate thymidylyltransferase / UDP-N-acetylgalactosamine diphosphorylase / glucosamine-1-phosphate N-acetyltransferase / galactosamine-1-phosphate N-acetyltransferase
MKAVILAAGKGTRMGDLTRTTPKPMLPVAGVPMIERVIQSLIDTGLREFVIVSGHLGQIVRAYLGTGDKLGCHIDHVVQEKLDGTASALKLTRDAVGDSSLLLTFADILMEPSNYTGIRTVFEEHRCDVAAAVRRVDDPHLGAAVYIDSDWNVVNIIEKPPKGTSTTPWNHSGMYCFQPAIYDYLEKIEPSGRGEYEIPDAVRGMIGDGLCVKAYQLDGYWKDLASPADIREAEALLSAGG